MQKKPSNKKQNCQEGFLSCLSVSELQIRYASRTNLFGNFSIEMSHLNPEPMGKLEGNKTIKFYI